MRLEAWTALLWLSSAFVVVLGETASFYGASYISVPLQDAKSTTDLRLKFRTRRSDGLLFLAAGRTDYCLVRLESGRLKVHINLGAGESEIASSKGLKLDDLTWHEVVITRKDADITLQVDTIHIINEKLPGRFYELNIHYGIFVGGQGDFSELFLGHLENMRGCMADVIYNNVNVLSRARERQGQVDVHGVTWSCAEEFEAGSEREISFVENGAFMALPNAISRTGARWQLELKTTTSRGILMYNTGLSSKSDFVGVELIDGHVRLLVDKGNGPAELISKVSVADGLWHVVAVHFNPTYMEISVDDQVASMRLSLGENRYLDLAETLFLGGIELNKRSRALGQGLKSGEVSFKGCFRSMDLDGKRIGIPEARITLGILPDCVWEYQCVRDPCIAGARCIQQGVDSFRCECGLPLCVKPDFATGYKVFTKTTLPVDLEIIALSPLQVQEGGNTLITSNNMDVVLDYPKFGVRESGVLFRLVGNPQHGQVKVDLWHRPSDSMFTLLDLNTDKVRYIHDGSENHQDSIVFELEFAAGSGFILPDYLQGQHRFVLHVNVTPVNDPPSLNIPAGKVLRLAEGTKKTLTSDLLSAEDPDNPTSDLVYTILSLGNNNKAYVENSKNPGKSIQTFTQRDINEGLIYYVHKGSLTSKLSLRVSDGTEAGETTILRVSAYELQIILVNNTGLVLTHNSSTMITPQNLSFTTNAEDQSLEIRYEVTKLPQFGTIQKLRTSSGVGSGPALSPNGGRWQTVNHFTSRQLAREQIRYLHTTGSPTHDEFKFQVSVMDATRSPTVYDFRITFVELRVEPVRNEELYLDGIQEAVISESYLLYETRPQPTDNSFITYHVVRPPRYGTLNLARVEPGSKHRRLGEGDTFTQRDIAESHLKYRLHRKSFSRVRDEFHFHVSTPDRSSDPAVFSVFHVPSGGIDVKVTLERLEVVEGGRQPISKSHLNLETDKMKEVIYNITHGPRHGRIDVLDPGLTDAVRTNVSWFASREVAANRVLYVHDDSESRKDAFHFVAIAADPDEDFQYVGVFHIDVILKNDNTPTRAVDKVFHVVKGGERLLTGNDLRYTDADIDTKPTDIQYTRRGIPNGGIFEANNPSQQVFHFSQDDLDKKQLLFRHRGDEYGKVVLWITDGQSHVTGILEVRASTPFIEVANNSGLIVKLGSSAQITLANLSSETNLNAYGEQLVYEVTEGPNHGILEVDGRSSSRFTELDLEEGRLTYRHDGSSTHKDHFDFRVQAMESSTEGRFEFRIFPGSYWEPLVVSSNRTLLVEESTSVMINPSYLKVMHPHISPGDITFIVQRPPRFGYLEVESAEQHVDTAEPAVDYHKPLTAPQQPEVTVFDQSLIDAGRLHYIQSAPNQTSDQFIVDVTNGIFSMHGLLVNLVVVPKHIYVSGGDLKVVEGKAVTLDTGLLKVLNQYYADKVEEYKVVVPPKAGILQTPSHPGMPLEKLSVSQLVAGKLQYQHDGGETLEDTFSIVAKAGDRESLPALVRVHVIPVNDEIPRIANNTGLELWEGATVAITSEHLAAVDDDTPPANLTFTITPPTSGYVALRSSPRVPVEQFTQVDINAKNVLFLHSGDKTGSFRFRVSDGVNTGKQHSFSITARDLTLQLTTNRRLHVFPLLRQPLTPAELLCVTSDHDATREVTFVVKSAPGLGRLVLESGGSSVEARNFTQQDVNASRVWYEHERPFSDLSANDSFVFDVSAKFTDTLEGQVFRIDISVSSMTSSGLDRFLQVEALDVEEGGTASVKMNTTGVVEFIESHSGWQSPVVQVVVTEPPTHGALAVEGENITAGLSFTQSQMDSSAVLYHHDHSDTTEDEILFSLYLVGKPTEDGDSNDVLLYNGTIPITVRPINDQPFTLLTEAPQMSVVQGQFRVITRDDLCTEDPDTSPDELVYEVISELADGKLVFSVDNVTNPTMKFTQADIDNEHVVYFHEGPVQPTKFYFRVWDGKFNPKYTIFNIQVLPLTLNVTNNSAIEIQQGSSVTFIAAENMAAVTNGRRDNVRYNVTLAPRHGNIYLHDVMVSSFGQMDVDRKLVMYMQTDMTTSNDSFEVTVFLYGTEVSIPHQFFNITVVPLVNIGNFSPVVGSKAPISIDVLDASPLAKLTSSNPVYQIMKRPRFGRIKRIIRSTSRVKRELREREVSRFTHEEVKSGVIYYVPRRMDLSEVVDDGFMFVLAASIFQPALGELRFKLLPEGYRTGNELGTQDDRKMGTHRASFNPTLQPKLNPGLPGGREGMGGASPEFASPNMSSDYILIVSVVVGVVVLAVLIIVVVKCRTMKSREERPGNKTEVRPGSAYGTLRGGSAGPNGDLYSSDIDTAPPLPRPPDHLLPHHPASPRPPRAKRFVSANGAPHYSDSSDSWREPSREVSPAVPHCKVIPLCGSEQGEVIVPPPPPSSTIPDSVPDVNARYPYGAPDEPTEEWSSYDTSSEPQYPPRTTNPMLRRNQYWV